MPYESPNIVIVPTVKFDGPPNKKPKLGHQDPVSSKVIDACEGEENLNIQRGVCCASDKNSSVKSLEDQQTSLQMSNHCVRNRESQFSEDVDVSFSTDDCDKMVQKTLSWASNYLKSIGQSKPSLAKKHQSTILQQQRIKNYPKNNKEKFTIINSQEKHYNNSDSQVGSLHKTEGLNNVKRNKIICGVDKQALETKAEPQLKHIKLNLLNSEKKIMHDDIHCIASSHKCDKFGNILNQEPVSKSNIHQENKNANSQNYKSGMLSTPGQTLIKYKYDNNIERGKKKFKTNQNKMRSERRELSVERNDSNTITYENKKKMQSKFNDDKYIKTHHPRQFIEKQKSPVKKLSYQEKKSVKPTSKKMRPERDEVNKRDYDNFKNRSIDKIKYSQKSNESETKHCESKCPTPIKSVVKVTENYTSLDNIRKTEYNTEDLRSKLKRKYFTNNDTTNVLRDNLLITVPNDSGVKDTEIDDKPDKGHPKVRQETKKYKKIKLVINLVCEKCPESSESDSDGKSNEYPLANVDLSFLDDINVDDIVECLNSPESKNHMNFNVYDPTGRQDKTKTKNLAPASLADDNNNNNTKEVQLETKWIDLNLRFQEKEQLRNDIKLENSLSNVDKNNQPLVKTEGNELKQDKVQVNTSTTQILFQRDIVITNDITKTLKENDANNVQVNDSEMISSDTATASSVIVEKGKVYVKQENNIAVDETGNTKKTEGEKTKLTCDDIHEIQESVTIEEKYNDIITITDSEEEEDFGAEESKHKTTEINTTSSGLQLDISPTFINLDKDDDWPLLNVNNNSNERNTKNSACIGPESKADVECGMNSSTVEMEIISKCVGLDNENHLLSHTFSNDSLVPLSSIENIEEPTLVSDVENNNEINNTIVGHLLSTLVDQIAQIKKPTPLSKTENANKNSENEQSNIITEVTQLIPTGNDNASLQDTKSDSKVEPITSESIAKTNDSNLKENDNKSKASTSKKVESDNTVIKNKSSTENGVKKASIITEKVPNSPVSKALLELLHGRMHYYFGEPYKITSLIRHGKFSKVFQCKNSRGRTYALKMIHPRCFTYRETEAMLKYIQRDIPKSNFHCIVLIDSFTANGQWCHLLEYFPSNLRVALADYGKSFHIDVIQNLFRQLVSALVVLGNNNIVHLGIKPEHILVNSSVDRVKLAGFDEARYAADAAVRPAWGTASYRPPEVILGFPALDRADVWAAALVLYEMATRRQLFPGRYNNDVLYQQQCALGAVPPDMLQHCAYSSFHYSGTLFLRVLSKKKKVAVHEFNASNFIDASIVSARERDWGAAAGAAAGAAGAAGAGGERGRARLRALRRLLARALALRPAARPAPHRLLAHAFLLEPVSARDVLWRA